MIKTIYLFGKKWTLWKLACTFALMAALIAVPLTSNVVSILKNGTGASSVSPLTEGDAPQQPEALDALASIGAVEPEHILCEDLESYDPEVNACENNTVQMGANPYWKANVSTATAFKNAIIGKGFNEGYGEQCVAGFKEFTYSLTGEVVATPTGGASGYANYAPLVTIGGVWHSGTDGIRNGDWGIFGDSLYGHVAMYYNGAWLGQNQSGGDIYIGAPFALSANIGLPVLGYWRWDAFNDVSPAQPQTPNEPVSPAIPADPPANSDAHAGLTWFYTYQYEPYTGQPDYKRCVEYAKGGCWAK